MENNKLLEKVHIEYKKLTEELIRRKITISCMESCTSGLIASLITDTAGASMVFKGGINAYNNEVKEDFGISSDTIMRFGVYSEQTAEEMAKRACVIFQTDIGIGVTGSLCTVDPANRDSIPGEVWFSICCAGKCHTKKITLDAGTSRFESKLEVAEKVFESLQLMYFEDWSSNK